jgi:hypothetical protein
MAEPALPLTTSVWLLMDLIEVAAGEAMLFT